MSEIFESNLPQSLTARLLAQYDEDTCRRIAAGYSAARKTAFRLNRRLVEGDAEDLLSSLGVDVSELAFYADGFLCAEGSESVLQKTAAYECGAIYLQNPSSMLPPLMLAPNAKENILDMCAAPGSKTTQLYSLCPTAYITACEKDKVRADRLRYNLKKQSAGGVSVLCSDARRLDSFLRFDKIMLDAPCSGSGTVRTQNPKSYGAFSDALVVNSSKLQQQLIAKAWSLLKIGGELVYSTCSVLYDENERVVESLLKKGGAEVLPFDERFAAIPQLPCKIEGALLVAPDEVFEGFFAVKLKKLK